MPGPHGPVIADSAGAVPPAVPKDAGRHTDHLGSRQCQDVRVASARRRHRGQSRADSPSSPWLPVAPVISSLDFFPEPVDVGAALAFLRDVAKLLQALQGRDGLALRYSGFLGDQLPRGEAAPCSPSRRPYNFLGCGRRGTGRKHRHQRHLDGQHHLDQGTFMSYP